MPRVNARSKISCLKCRKTIRQNQKYSQCAHCQKTYHNKCLYPNLRKTQPTNLNWNCTSCASHQSQSTNSRTETDNNQLHLDSQLLNNIFEQILPNRDNNIETDMISQDIYLTTDEFNELCNKGNVKKLFYKH